MKVKELIEKLQQCKNQNARVNLFIPARADLDSEDDISTSDFEVLLNTGDTSYIEIYSNEGFDDKNYDPEPDYDAKTAEERQEEAYEVYRTLK